MKNEFIRIITTGEDYEEAKLEGSATVRTVAVSAYGAGAGNVMIERNFGAPITSRDGVSNLEQLHVSDPVQNMVIQTIVQASQRTNQHAGDGTTATAILAADLYSDGIRRIRSGENRMDVSRSIIATSREVIDYVNSRKKKATKRDLKNVARISSGDEGLGNMVNYIFEEFDGDGGVTVSMSDGNNTTVSIEDGFYFRSGFVSGSLITDPGLRESRLRDAVVLVCSKVLKSSSDLIGILDPLGQWAEENHKLPLEFVLIADVEGEALVGLAQNDGKIFRPTVISPLGSGARKQAFLEDAAAYVGGHVIKNNEFDASFFGHADEIIVTQGTSNIIGGAPREDVDRYLADIQKQLDASVDQYDHEFLEERVNRLKGKVASVVVGGETEAVRIEKKLRVDDAVNAVRSARAFGIVPGEAITLLEVSSIIDGASPYSNLFTELLINGGIDEYDVDKFADTALLTKDMGYDLSDPLHDLVNLRKQGIVDPVQVVVEAVKNAAAVAALLVTSVTAMYYENRDTKRD